jgi:hypothetical protein
MPAAALTGSLHEWLFTAFGGIRIPVGPPNLQLYGTLGARYFYIHTGLDLSFPVVGFEPNYSF